MEFAYNVFKDTSFLEAIVFYFHKAAHSSTITEYAFLASNNLL
jgi:hypothetical protein